MRLWQRRTHPWIWFLIALAVAAAFAALVQNDPSLLKLG